VFELVSYAERHKILPKLIEGARQLEPGARELQLLFQLVDAGPVRPADALHSRCRSARAPRSEPHQFRGPHRLRSKPGCRIESPAAAVTGLLVHEDLVLTNYHVMHPVYAGELSRDDVRFRFDYKWMPDGTELIGQTRCGLPMCGTSTRVRASAQDEILNGGEPARERAGLCVFGALAAEKVESPDQFPKDRDAPAALVSPGYPSRHCRQSDPLLVLQYPGKTFDCSSRSALLVHHASGRRVRHNGELAARALQVALFRFNLAARGPFMPASGAKRAALRPYNQAIRAASSMAMRPAGVVVLDGSGT